MIHVLAVIEALGRGGAERLLVDMATRLDRSRFHLEVITLFAVRRDYQAALSAVEVEETCLDLRGPRDCVKGVISLVGLIRKRKVDLVHTHLFMANVIGRTAAMMARRPVISTLHGVDYEPVVRQGSPTLTRTKQAALQWADRLTAKAASAMMVAVSEYVAASARSRLGVSPGNLRVIPNAVDTTRFCPDRGARARIRQTLDLAADTAAILCVGKLIPDKGQGLLLEALAGLAAEAPCPSWVLLIAGEGDSREIYEEQVHALGLQGRVRFLGNRDDIPDLMRAADVLVLPSRHEGFGLVLAEALASGLPVVASRIPPILEIVSEGRTGLLFDLGDGVGLATCVRTLLLDPDERRLLGARGRKEAVEHFDLPRMVHAIEDLYVEVLARDGAPTSSPRPL